MKKLISIICTISIILMSIVASAIPALASATVSITPNGTSVDYTKNISVRISVSATENIMNTEGILTYDETKLQYLSAGGDYAEKIGSGQIKIYDEAFKEGDKKGSYTIKFKALTTGSMSVSYSGMYVNWNAEGINMSGSASFTASDPSKSDANLSSLTVSAGSLSPKFSANTTNYTVTVDNDVENLTVNAKANGEATVAGTGNIALKVGSNKHTVTVTAPDGTKKNYTITVTRRDENDTSSEDETDEDETTDEPAPDVLAVHIAGKPYHVLSELPETPVAPMGFETSTAEYNGAPVAVYASAEKEYVLYILKNDESGALDFYTYDSLRDDFLLLPYANFNDKMYILAAPSETAFAPEGYIDTELNIGNSNIRAFAALNDGMRDFYMIRCFADGEFKYYSYDSSEKTLQRAPDFKPIEREQLDIDTTPDNSDKNLLEWFKGIPVTGKTVIFAVAIIAICAIAIIVLLIIRAAKRPQFSDGDGILFEPEDEFDEIKGATFPFKLEDEETAPEIQEKAEDVE